MKMISHILKSGFLFLSLTLFTTACCKVDAKQDRVEKNLEAGSWKITLQTYQGNDETSNVTAYKLTFESEGTLTASNGTATHYGTWSLNYDDDNVENQTLHLSILQNPANVFENFSRDWKFIGQTSTRIKLKHENAVTDYLTIERRD